jgi:phosphomannomutase
MAKRTSVIAGTKWVKYSACPVECRAAHGVTSGRGYRLCPAAEEVRSVGQLEAIFKAYDIRGRVDTGELDVMAAEQIGFGFASRMNARRIAVGRDCRETSPDLAAAFGRGARLHGTSVIDLGEVATDVVYYYAGVHDVPGAMITASHNPPAYNGIKLCGPGAAPISADTGLLEIAGIAAGHRPDPSAMTEGGIEHDDPIPGYIEHVLSVIDPSKVGALRVAVDGGNGMAGVAIGRVFDELAAELIGLYLEPDGTFPNHPADPLDPANLVDLVEFMKATGADVGVAFDGDADRAFFIDDRLEPLSGSTTTAIVADWFLAREPGAAIVHNLICSRAVPEAIVAAGGRPIRTRVGHSYIKAVMAESGAVFGGEHSGHYYFRDNFRADSGTLAMLVLLQVVSESGVPLSELRRRYEPYAASGEINLSVADRQEALDLVADHYADQDVDRLDGLTVSWPDRWFNLRPSNTESLLRLNVEAPDRSSVADMVAEVSALVP